MTFAYWMLLVAALLPYFTVGLAKSGGFDNHAPRPSLEGLRGWRRRAVWAHQNHFEAFPAFAAAVIVAELVHAPQSRIDLLAGIFVLLRLDLYGVVSRLAIATHFGTDRALRARADALES